MRQLLLGLLVGSALIPALAFGQSAQPAGCPTNCPSRQCAHQCLGPDCSFYCVRSPPGPRATSMPAADLDLHIPNATPALAARIRSLIEDKKAH
jgi:hypothetical protein